MLLPPLINEVTGRVVAEIVKLSEQHKGSTKHFRNAEVEFLKGIRAFIDEEISRLDHFLEEAGQSSKQD